MKPNTTQWLLAVFTIYLQQELCRFYVHQKKFKWNVQRIEVGKYSYTQFLVSSYLSYQN